MLIKLLLLLLFVVAEIENIIFELMLFPGFFFFKKIGAAVTVAVKSSGRNKC